MKIGSINIPGNVFLAPMAGVGDVAFRSLAIMYGCKLTTTEMISAKALLYNNKKTLDLLKTADNENIKVVQLFGHEPNVFKKVLQLKCLEKFDIIDLNMGCPAQKIVNNFDGASLMKNIDLAREIITTCVNNSNKPITVKFRKGFDDCNINYLEFGKMCESAGASAVTIHARTKTQMYSGNADLNAIKILKENLKIPVIANGDVRGENDYIKMIQTTNCDGVMIGRGALGNLEIFSEITHSNIPFSKFICIKKHIEILRNIYGDNFTIKHMRKHLLWYLQNIPNIKKEKNEIVKIDDFDTLFDKLSELFD